MNQLEPARHNAVSLRNRPRHGAFVLLVGSLTSLSIWGYFATFRPGYGYPLVAIFVAGLIVEYFWFQTKGLSSIPAPSIKIKRWWATQFLPLILLLNGLSMAVKALGKMWWPSPGGSEVFSMLGQSIFYFGAIACMVYMKDNYKWGLCTKEPDPIDQGISEKS